MTLKHLLGATALAVLPMCAFAQNGAEMPPCENCSDNITIMSWGGAYQAMQQKTYAEPYAAATGVNIIWDESSNEAVAKLRAKNEAGNVTWDVVDALATDGIRLCDEGLVAAVPLDEWLAPTPDGTPASEDFGEEHRLRLPHPDEPLFDDLRLSHRCCRLERQGTRERLRVFDLEKFPGKRALEKRPINNLEWALICSGVPVDQVYDTLETEEGVDKALAKLDTIKDRQSGGRPAPRRRSSSPTRKW